MITRRIVRVGTVYSRTGHFIGQGLPRGGSCVGFMRFEDELNQTLESGHIKVFVAFILMGHDELLPALVDGRIDVAVASLTATPERLERVDFSNPVLAGVDEIVTGPGSRSIASDDDLAGEEVFVRTSSSHYQGLAGLNTRFAAEKQPAVVVKPAPEEFEDEDVREMVNAGLGGVTVVDNHNKHARAPAFGHRQFRTHLQKTKLDQRAKSHVGAIGVMQVMPATGQELKVGGITQIGPNIHAGVTCIRFMIDRCFTDDPMTPLNKGLFAFAAYNAGPGRVSQLRRQAAEGGLDPNVWFNNVERVAAERIGRETMQYVSNIYKYYIAYTLAMEQMDAKKALTQ
jgi:membrane-bound lytic murein transglycosylase MltF